MAETMCALFHAVNQLHRTSVVIGSGKLLDDAMKLRRVVSCMGLENALPVKSKAGFRASKQFMLCAST